MADPYASFARPAQPTSQPDPYADFAAPVSGQSAPAVDPGIEVMFPGDPGYVAGPDDLGRSRDRALWPRDQAEIDSLPDGTWYLDLDGLTKRKGDFWGGAFARTAGLLGEVNQMIPFADELAAAGGAGIDMAQAGLAGEQIPNFGAAYQNVRRRQDAMSQDINADMPNAAAFARGVGLAAPTLVPGAQGAMANFATRAGLPSTLTRLPPPTRLQNIAQGIGAASASAGLSAAGQGNGGAAQRLQQGVGFQGAMNPAAIALGGVAGRLTPVAPSARRQINPDVARLAREGIRMTPGQVQGGMLNRVEQALTSVPGVGDSITRARRDSVVDFNRSVANRALQPIGERLPANVTPGREAVDFLQTRLGSAYDEILPQMRIVPDQQLLDDIAPIADIAQDMTPQGRATLENILGRRVTSRIQNREEISGPELQRIVSELGTVRGRFASSPDADQRAIAEGIDVARTALQAAGSRQNPALGRALSSVNQGYGRLATYENAMAGAGVSELGATPRQLEAAMRRGDRTVRRRATAAGNARDQDFMQSAVNVLPQTVPDTGTALRGIAGVGIGAGGFALEPTVATTAIGVSGAGMLAYSRPAIDAYNRALNRALSAQERRLAVEQLGGLATRDPALMPLVQRARDAVSTSAGIAATQ
jgi:hypothetical protein